MAGWRQRHGWLDLGGRRRGIWGWRRAAGLGRRLAVAGAAFFPLFLAPFSVTRAAGGQ